MEPEQGLGLNDTNEQGMPARNWRTGILGRTIPADADNTDLLQQASDGPTIQSEMVLATHSTNEANVEVDRTS